MDGINGVKCRTCLSEDVSELISWCTLISDDENLEMTYLDCYRECTLLDARADDQLPQTICCQCAEQMRDAYYFIRRAKDSQRTLMMELGGEAFGSMEFEWVTIDKRDESSSPGEELNTTAVANQQPPAQHLPSPVHAESKASKSYSPHNFDLQNQILNMESDSDECFDEKIEENTKQSVTEPKKEQRKKPNQSKTKEKPPYIPPDTLVSCEVCGITIAKKDLSFHRYRKHKPKTLLCDACPLIFKTQFDLQAHAQVHAKNRPRNFTCDKCGQKFMTKGCLRCHVKTHDPNRHPKFLCDLCDKSFYYRGDLNEHKRVHTSERHKCEICSKEYVRAIQLKYHLMRTHSGEKPFKCPHCEKAFTRRGVLNQHLPSHEGIMFKCKVCSKEYTRQSGLLRHRLEHTGVLPFKCSICEKGFTERYKAKRHVATVHKVDQENEAEQLIIRIENNQESLGRNFIKTNAS